MRYDHDLQHAAEEARRATEEAQTTAEEARRAMEEAQRATEKVSLLEMALKASEQSRRVRQLE